MNNKPLSWKMLLIVGAILHVGVYVSGSENIFILGIGVVGDVMFLIGLVNMIVFFVKNKK